LASSIDIVLTNTLRQKSKNLFPCALLVPGFSLPCCDMLRVELQAEQMAAGQRERRWGEKRGRGARKRAAPTPFHSAVFRISYGLPVLKQARAIRTANQFAFSNERLVACRSGAESTRSRQQMASGQRQQQSSTKIIALPNAYGILSVRGLGAT
jgi:hypothetical protein